MQWHLLDFVRTYKDDDDFRLTLGMAGTLESIQPLSIDESKSSSYKEMWEDSHALLSLQQHRMYEAGASIFWCAMGVESSKFFFDAVSWESLEEFRSKLWGESARVQSRLVFPTPIHVWLTKSMEESAGSLQKLLQGSRKFPILNGMTVVNSWYLAVALALRDKDTAVVKDLVRAGLTVTLNVRLLESESDGYKQAMILSGQQKLSAQANGESLLSWLVRYEFLSKSIGTNVVAQHVKFAKDESILFDLKPVTTSVMTAVYLGYPFIVFSRTSCLACLVGLLRFTRRPWQDQDQGRAHGQGPCHAPVDFAALLFQNLLGRVLQALESRVLPTEVPGNGEVGVDLV